MVAETATPGSEAPLAPGTPVARCPHPRGGPPVGEEHGGKPQREGIFVDLRGLSGGLSLRLPAVGKRHAPLAQNRM